MKKRFMAGKIGLGDLVTTEEGRKRFKTLSAHQTVVYDEDTTTFDSLPTSNSVYLVVSCLKGMGQMPYMLEGQCMVLVLWLCNISVFGGFSWKSHGYFSCALCFHSGICIIWTPLFLSVLIFQAHFYCYREGFGTDN